MACILILGGDNQEAIQTFITYPWGLDRTWEIQVLNNKETYANGLKQYQRFKANLPLSLQKSQRKCHEI